MENVAATSVGLGGDGDEVAAIQEVERTFGVELDPTDAPKWVTAGDVFSSLLEKLPPDERAQPKRWVRFAEAITRETGVDPTTISPASPLLSTTRVPYWVIGVAIALIFALAFFRPL